MNTVIDLKPVNTVSNQTALGWLQRRAEQEFVTPETMKEYLRDRSARSTSVQRKNAEIEIVAENQPQTLDDMNKLMVRVDGQLLDFSHWSFGQLAQLAKAPSNYLRSLPGQLVRDNLHYSLAFNREVEDVKLYHNGEHLRAITGPNYGRVDDWQVVEAVESILDSGRWKPADEHMGLRVSDRSVNMFLIDQENPIVVGTAPDGSDDVMYRGLRISNSEVGFSSLKVEGFTFRSYCLNGCIFGMTDSETVNVRHSKNAAFRWAREVQPAIENYANRDASSFVKAVEMAKGATVAEDNDRALSWLTNRGLNRTQANNAIERIQIEEGREPRTVWDMVQGITAVARNITHVEDRADLERTAGRIFHRVAA